MCPACLLGLCDRCAVPCICRERDHPVLSVRVYEYGPPWLAPFAATVSNAAPGLPVWARYVFTSLN